VTVMLSNYAYRSTCLGTKELNNSSDPAISEIDNWSMHSHIDLDNAVLLATDIMHACTCGFHRLQNQMNCPLVDSFVQRSLIKMSSLIYYLKNLASNLLFLH